MVSVHVNITFEHAGERYALDVTAEGGHVKAIGVVGNCRLILMNSSENR